MAEAELRPFADGDLGWAHALNQANGEALSFMDRPPFEALVRRAWRGNRNRVGLVRPG